MNMPAVAKTLVQAACASVMLLLATSPVYGAATEFVVPSGPLITLQDGRVIEGDVVRIDQNDVVIQTPDGVALTLPRATVESVSFETVTGQQLVGELVGWAPGVYQITTAEAAIKVYSTMPAVVVTPERAITAAAAGASQEQAPTPEVANVAPSSGQGGSQAIAAVTVEDAANGENAPAPSNAAGNQEAALSPSSSLSIAVSVENSVENGPPVAFNIELSQPSDSSVVLIYATIDGTAISGQDYEANRGVVVIKPGDQVARIEAPVIDDAELEDQEHLQLFLTVDPTVAVVENRQIIATIDDDDQG